MDGSLHVDIGRGRVVTLLEDELKKQIESGKTRTIYLPRKKPIMFLYVTVLVQYDGMIHFRDDIYGRDEAVIKGLNAPFEFKPKHATVF